MKATSWLIGGAWVCAVVPALAQPAPVPPPSATAPPVIEDAEPRPPPELESLEPVPGGLTADEVARRSRASSAMVRARFADYEVASARIDQTVAQFLPRLTLSASYTRLSPVAAGLGGGALVGAANAGLLSTGPCPNGGTGTCVLDAQGQPVGAASFAIRAIEDNYSFKAELIIPLSDYILRLSSAFAAVRDSKRAAEMNIMAERLSVATSGRVAYYTWLRARGAVEVSGKSAKQVQARLDDARAAYSVGAISKADLMRLEALAANTELTVKQASTLEQLAQEQLVVLMTDGDPKKASGPRQLLPGENAFAPVRQRVEGSVEALQREALTNRLELKVIDDNVQAIRKGAKSVDVGKWPRVDAFGNVEHANPNPRFFPPTQEWNTTWALGVRASWELSAGLNARAQAAEYEAQARGLEAQQEALRDGIRQEVAQIALDRERSMKAVETSNRQLEASEEAYRVATDLYRVGRANTTELIAAETELLQARLGQLNALLDLKIAETRLQHAVGRDVPR